MRERILVVDDEPAIVDSVSYALRRDGYEVESVEDGRVAVEVTDTGPGIDETERELVRQRFYRGGGRDRSGFGLGLAIAEQAARALDGSLELEPGPQGGTTVRLLLPAATC